MLYLSDLAGRRVRVRWRVESADPALGVAGEYHCETVDQGAGFILLGEKEGGDLTWYPLRDVQLIKERR